MTNGLLFSSIFVGLKSSLSVSFSLKPASVASAVCHPYQIIVLYMLTTLLNQDFKLLYEGKNTACMVNMVIVLVGGSTCSALYIYLEVHVLLSCYTIATSHELC